MFGRLFKKSEPKPTPNPIRETLFGDLPIDRWGFGVASPGFPWNAFAAARDLFAAGDTEGALARWQEVAAAPGLEPRHHLQAWHFLRQHGRQPPADVARNVLGMVVEVGMPKGLDLLAAYRDHFARYYNFSDAGIVWEHPDDSLDSIIDALLAASAEVVARIGPWDKDRPPPPPTGHMRLSFLTPSGLHFGQGEMSTLSADPLGGRVVQLATGLMQALMAKRQ